LPTPLIGGHTAPSSHTTVLRVLAPTSTSSKRSNVDIFSLLLGGDEPLEIGVEGCTGRGHSRDDTGYKAAAGWRRHLAIARGLGGRLGARIETAEGVELAPGSDVGEFLPKVLSSLCRRRSHVEDGVECRNGVWFIELFTEIVDLLLEKGRERWFLVFDPGVGHQS